MKTGLSGRLIDIANREIYPATVTIEGKRIAEISRDHNDSRRYILPGLTDSHVHVESSMLTPAEFAAVVVRHGQVAAVADAHEIANVMGTEGIRYMMENGNRVPFKFYFGAPSCVPATRFETSGAVIDAKEVETLLSDPDIKYLGEMMNFPGVVGGKKDIMSKIEAAKSRKKPVDGHAPGLSGKDLKTYAESGISTDHECTTLEEAREKLELGMNVIIREGTAARNLEELIPALKEHPGKIMFCSDDMHPGDLTGGGIINMVKKALALGYDLFQVLLAACVKPVEHYGLDVGLLREGDPADLVVVNNLKDFKVEKTYIDGELVCRAGRSLIKPPKARVVNNFNTGSKQPEDFQVEDRGGPVRVIVAKDGSLVTGETEGKPEVKGNNLVSDPDKDVLKIAVVNRYRNSTPAIGFVTNFNLREGAVASSIAHDSHNIVVVGVKDADMARAVNRVVEGKGGLVVAQGKKMESLPLPIAGIMSDLGARKVAERYDRLQKKIREMGSDLRSPLMTLSFMALPVIPKLKITDKGLFDVERFSFTDLFIDQDKQTRRQI